MNYRRASSATTLIGKIDCFPATKIGGSQWPYYALRASKDRLRAW